MLTEIESRRFGAHPYNDCATGCHAILSWLHGDNPSVTPACLTYENNHVLLMQLASSESILRLHLLSIKTNCV